MPNCDLFTKTKALGCARYISNQKRYGILRFGVDFRALIIFTAENSNPLRRIDLLMDQIGMVQYF